ncbi:MAG TPA: CopD family protein [Chthoniobacterales bacterium]|jgi:putative copper resistance protein D
MTAWLVGARAVHIGACLLLFGIFAFDHFVLTALRRETGRDEHRRICVVNLTLLPVILLSGVVWLLLVAMNMSGEPLHSDIVKTVWLQTEFGAAWRVRLILWLAAVLGAAGFYLAKQHRATQTFLLWLQLILSGALLGSLAYAGHGLGDSHWHLYADVLHLLIAGIWPTGLLPFLLRFNGTRRRLDQAGAEDSAKLVRRFSAISLGSVAVLTLTGLVNSWFLVGSVTNLLSQPYGRWLLLKLLLFVLAVAIGAVNLLHLKPRLTRAGFSDQDLGATTAQLSVNVRVELLLGSAVIVVVAILGVLPPAMH